jgi:hypothetical protein
MSAQSDVDGALGTAGAGGPRPASPGGAAESAAPGGVGERARLMPAGRPAQQAEETEVALLRQQLNAQALKIDMLIALVGAHMAASASGASAAGGERGEPLTLLAP